MISSTHRFRPNLSQLTKRKPWSKRICSRPQIRRGPSKKSRSPRPFQILKETEHWLAINKPAGVNSDPRESINEPGALPYFLREYHPDLKKVFTDLPQFGLIHRLNFFTSGVLLIAKDLETYKALKKLFQNQEMNQTYCVLVFGVPEPLTGKIDKDVMYITEGKHVATPEEVEDWKLHGAVRKDALTHYRVLAQFELNGRLYSYIHAQKRTGRTHQIRYHFQQIGHPIIGESYYITNQGRPDRLPKSLKQFFPRNPALHAQEVLFRDPQSNEIVKIFCQHPTPFEEALDFLEEYEI